MTKKTLRTQARRRKNAAPKLETPAAVAPRANEPMFTLTELAAAFGSNFSAGDPYTAFSFAREAIDDAHRELRVIYSALGAEDPENPIVDAIHNMNCRLELAGNVLAKFYRAERLKAEVQS